MSPPWLARVLVRAAARSERRDDALGDLEEVHRARVARSGRWPASFLTTVEAVDVARALLRERLTRRGGSGTPSDPSVRRIGASGGPPFSALDLKLGARMLVRYPALTLVGGLAMAFAIFVGAGSFEILRQVVYPSLPLPEGDRIVGIRVVDASTGRPEARLAFDLVVWRELETLDDVGGFREIRRNLVTGNGPGPSMAVALIAPSGFRVAGVPPLLGRTLIDEDARAGATPTVVLGYEVWRSVFDSDPDAVGRTVRLGATPTTVVGVMPKGFAFPFNQQLWSPLTTEDLPAPRERAGLIVFGRLSAGSTLDRAQAELTAIGRRLAVDHPETHEHLRPRVMPYPRMLVGAQLSEMQVSALFVTSNVPIVLFVVLVCGNVALLTFARAAAREPEMVVRSALGAGHRRIAGQLFAEALVLAGAASVVGLVGVQLALKGVFRVLQAEFLGGDPLPFWIHPGLSASTVAYACMLAVVAAVVAGIVPARKLKRGLGDRLKRATAGGGGFRFGGVWTAVIVAQIAVTVLAPVFTFELWNEAKRVVAPDLGVDATRFLSARLEIDDEATVGPFQMPIEAGPSADGYRSVARDLEERLELAADVLGVTFTERLPRLYHPNRHIEVDGPSAEPIVEERGHNIATVAVPLDYLPLMDAEILRGRGFASGDVGADVVIVNERFVDVVLGGRNPIGRRVRYAAGPGGTGVDEAGPWLEVIGLVRDLGTRSGFGGQGMYHPSEPGRLLPLHVVVRTTEDARAFEGTLRRVAGEVAPNLRLEQVRTLEEVTYDQARFYGFWLSLLIATTSLALLLSLGGIYAIMSFTVVQRTREIGIRVALGSGRSRVVAAILRRPFLQMAFGVAWGLLAVGGFYDLLGLGDGGTIPPALVGGVAAYTAFMACVCASACVIPIRRALAVEPSEALRAEG